jgi:hypothetical protein
MEKLRLDLEPTSVPEWDAEDELAGVLADDMLVKADETQAREMLDKTLLELPAALDWVELITYAQQHKTPGGLEVPPDSGNYSFYSVQIPLTIILAGDHRLVRLRLQLELQAEQKKHEDIMAYDLFPTTQVDVNKLASGEASLDVSKALQFVLSLSGATAPLAPLSECLGLKLSLPFQWTSTFVRLQSSGRMSNPVHWYVTDSAIQNGFAPNAILRAPKGATVTVSATLIGELRHAGPFGRFFKTQFQPPQPRTYVLR